MSNCGTLASNSSTSSSGEKSRMKQFINAAQEYSKTKSEDVASILSRTLQLIGVSLDINTFDPNSSVVAEFFVSLHELMNSLDPRSPLAWFAVTVLQQACRNKSAHKALIHTYQFLPILSRLLGDHLARDKKQKLLTLMQELTYGINISWQISYLPHLLTTLTKWIESGDEGVTSLSLGVLLNLCHKNLPVIYTLMRTVNTKHFLKTIMAMKNPATDVQVCKLLIILEHINGEVPQEDILHFVRVTFRTIVEAFKIKDLMRLRHIVEFFLEVRKEKDSVSAVCLYDHYHDDVVKILNAVENNFKREKNSTDDSETDLECMALLFEFLHSLIELKIPDLRKLHGRMVHLSLGWVQTEIVSSKSLSLLRSIAVQPESIEDQQSQVQVLEPLASGLSVLLHIVDSAVPSGGPFAFTHSEQGRKLTALLQLLRVLVINDSFQSKVTSSLKQSSILKIFDALLETDDNHLAGGESRLKESFSNELNELYVHAVALVCALAKVSKSWEPFLGKIFGHKQMHAVLAHAFYSSNQLDTKLLVFEIAKCKQFPLVEIAKIMTEIQPSTVASQQACQPQNISYPEGVYTSCAPIISGTQLEQLDRVINRMNEALNNNQVQSIATSEVMELYEFKMASIGHAERAAQASLEAATQNVTHLQHRLAQVSTEVTRLHQLLFHAQQCNEESKKQLKLSEENIASLSARLTKEQVKNKELSQQLASAEKTVEDQVATIHILEQKVNENIQNNNYLSKKYEDTVNKNIALVKASKVIENNILTLKASLDEKNTILTKNSQQIEDLSKQVRELEELRKRHEETISLRDRDLCETQRELEERKRILDTITKLTRS